MISEVKKVVQTHTNCERFFEEALGLGDSGGLLLSQEHVGCCAATYGAHGRTQRGTRLMILPLLVCQNRKKRTICSSSQLEARDSLMVDFNGLVSCSDPSLRISLPPGFLHHCRETIN